jgi:hypothetical protein
MAEGSTASAGAPLRHRRTYLVDRGFQLRYAALLAVAGAVLALFCGLWLHQAHVQATELLPLDAETRMLVERGDRELLAALLGITALMALALGVLGVVMTHRVAGPVLVLSRHLSALARGQFPRVRSLRRSDELQGIFRLLTSGVEALRARERRHADLLEEAAAAVRQALPRVPELGPTLTRLEEAARERREALADSPPPPPSAEA